MDNFLVGYASRVVIYDCRALIRCVPFGETPTLKLRQLWEQLERKRSNERASESQLAKAEGAFKTFKDTSTKMAQGEEQCDQIGRFIGLWATF